MTKKARIILSILICFFVILLCFSQTIAKFIAKTIRQQELNKMFSYEVYSTFIATREVYYVYEMCNPKHTLSDIITQKFTKEYFKLLKEKIDDAETIKAPTEVYMMISSNELPYGWEKDELNISMNFDKSIFHRHTAYVVTIPYGADSLNDCSIRSAD